MAQICLASTCIFPNISNYLWIKWVKNSSCVFMSYSIVLKMANLCFAAVPSLPLFSAHSLILLCPSLFYVTGGQDIAECKFCYVYYSHDFYMETFPYIRNFKISCTFLLCNWHTSRTHCITHWLEQHLCQCDCGLLFFHIPVFISICPKCWEYMDSLRTLYM